MTTNNALNVGLSGSTGTGAFVGSVSGTLITPNIGTPTSGNLTNATGYTVDNLDDVTWTDFSGSVGFTGFSAAPTSVVARYKKIGKTCFIFISMTPGTSDATSFTLTGLPFTSVTGITQITGSLVGTNNSIAVPGIDGVITTASTTLILRLLKNGGAFTASGTKGFDGMFFYETA